MLTKIYIDKPLFESTSLPPLTNQIKIIPITSITYIINDIQNDSNILCHSVYISQNLESLLEVIKLGVCCIGYDTDNSLFNPLLKNIILDTTSLTPLYINSLISHHNGRPAVIYEDNKLVIRELTFTDFDILYAMFNSDSPKSLVFLDGYMTDSYDVEKEKFNAYISNQYTFYGYGQYCIILKAFNTIIGQCGFYEDNAGNTCLSYYINSQYRRLGIAYKSCYMLLEYITKEICISSIYAHINEDNIPSINLINKLGFIHTSKDTYIYQKDC